MTCPPKVKLKTIKKSNFRYVSTQNRTLASLAFLVIRFLCLPARSFFAFWDATQTEISTTLSKVHIRALQKGIKRKKESEFCYTSDIDKKHFSLVVLLEAEALESLGCKFLILFMRHILLLLKNLHRILLYEKSFLAFVVNWNWFSKAAICEL